jgi:threonine synthase
MLDALRKSGGGAIAVSDEALSAEAAAGSRLEGIDFAPEGGAAIAAARALAASGVLRPDQQVVLFNTGAGWLYRDPSELLRG